MSNKRIVIKIGGKKIKVGEKLSKKEIKKANIEKLIKEILEIGKDPNISHGIMDLAQLFIEINKKRIATDQADIEEVEKALDKLKDQNLISIKKTKNKIVLIEFTPLELTGIENTILELAAEKGWTNLEEVMRVCNLNLEIAEKELKKLENKDIAVPHKDRVAGKRWYFPGIYVPET
ncbi:MAG: hypothetical protein ACTSO9_08030 [Candidatus Helarchaeota archaeon]